VTTLAKRACALSQARSIPPAA